MITFIIDYFLTINLNKWLVFFALTPVKSDLKWGLYAFFDTRIDLYELSRMFSTSGIFLTTVRFFFCFDLQTNWNIPEKLVFALRDPSGIISLYSVIYVKSRRIGIIEYIFQLGHHLLEIRFGIGKLCFGRLRPNMKTIQDRPSKHSMLINYPQFIYKF